MKGKHHIALRLITFLVYVFLIGPLLIIMASSFGEQNALVFPGQGFTFKRYAQVFQMNAFINAALLSIGIGLTALRRELTGALRPFRKAAEKYADMIERKQNLLVTPKKLRYNEKEIDQRSIVRPAGPRRASAADISLRNQPWDNFGFDSTNKGACVQ